MVCEISITGFSELEKWIKGMGKVAGQVAAKGLVRCGYLAQREAVANAPRSPTKAEYSATLKRKKETSRKNFFPGGLEKSIMVDWDKAKMAVVICVRDNSYAAKYARKIHDEKGKTWRNRGPGTIAKGKRADEKFIERAIRENEDKFSAILADEFGNALRGMKR